MFKFKNTASPAPVSAQFDNSCFTLILTGLTHEHTNAEALWQKKFSAHPDIKEKNSGDTGYRLRDALQEHKAERFFYREKSRRKRPSGFVYSDVWVWLPRAVYDREIRKNTGALAALQTNLSFLHNDVYKGELLDDRMARYALLPSSRLAENEVAFQFGEAVFVADGDDQSESVLEATLVDGSGRSEAFLPPLSARVDRKDIDNAVYSAQKNLFVVKPSEHLCMPLTNQAWFADGCSHLQLQRSDDAWEAFAVGPESEQIEVTCRRAQGGWLFEFKDGAAISHQGGVPQLQVRLLPAAGPTPPPGPDHGLQPEPPPDNVNPNRAWGRTVIPDLDRSQTYKTIIPGLGGAVLRLQGLGLPRIDAALRIKGLQQWTIWFDQAGNIVDASDPIERAALAALSANDREATAYFRLPGQAFARIDAPQPLVLAGRQASVWPSPLKDHYHFIVELLNPIEFALQENQTYTLGRRSEEAIPEIDLGLLDDPLGMLWTPGSAYAGSPLSALCLSRSHVHIAWVDDGLQLQVEKDKQPVFLLHDDLSLKAVLQSKTQTSEAVLQPDECVLAGSFLLRFCL